MSIPCFPLGWDEERLNRLIAHYESLSEEEQVAEDEAAVGVKKRDRGLIGGQEYEL